MIRFNIRPKSNIRKKSTGMYINYSFTEMLNNVIRTHHNLPLVKSTNKTKMRKHNQTIYLNDFVYPIKPKSKPAILLSDKLSKSTEEIQMIGKSIIHGKSIKHTKTKSMKINKAKKQSNNESNLQILNSLKPLLMSNFGEIFPAKPNMKEQKELLKKSKRRFNSRPASNSSSYSRYQNSYASFNNTNMLEIVSRPYTATNLPRKMLNEHNETLCKPKLITPHNKSSNENSLIALKKIGNKCKEIETCFLNICTINDDEPIKRSNLRKKSIVLSKIKKNKL